MKLSSILPLLDIHDYIIEREHEYEYLSLCDAKSDYKCCAFIEDGKFIERISENIVMLITKKELESRLNGRKYGLCFVDNPRDVFFRLHNYLSEVNGYKRKQMKTTIGEGCSISTLSNIAKTGVIIGNNCIIEDFVVIRANTTIGDRCVIRSGTVVGGEGFEFKKIGDDLLAVRHAGGVKIGNDVEL